MSNAEESMEVQEGDSSINTEAHNGEAEKPEEETAKKEDDEDIAIEDDDSKKDEEGDAAKKDFSSENFKIELHGMPKFYGIGQLKKLLNGKLNLRTHKIKPAGAGHNFVYVSFKNEVHKKKAMEKLQGYSWKKNEFSVKEAGPAPDPMPKKRKNDGSDDTPFLIEDGGDGIKKTKVDEEEANLSIAERIKKVTIPYADIDYKEQLLLKHKDAENVIRTLGNGLKKNNPDLLTWMKAQKTKYDGLCCELYNTRASPVTTEYRNKCEFTIGMNPETNERTIGFRLASYKEGSVGVAPVDHLVHLPTKMKSVVKYFEEFIRESSLEPYNPETHEGFWRQLTVRLTRKEDLMIVVVLHPQSLNETAISKVKENIKKFVMEVIGTSLGVTSLYFQCMGQKESGVDPPFELIWGEKYINETINGLSFKISPDSFFQTNVQAAELLYNTIAEVAELDSTTTLLDVCCGTGTIGISMSTTVGQVLGVELVEEAVECAKENSFANGVLNCQFFAGKAETILHQVMGKVLFKNVVAVVDPPRAGLHNKAMAVLRKSEDIKKLVYISCDPKAACKNFQDLGRPYSNTFQGDPFIPVKAIPIDMFPNTPHYELVVLFERFDPEQFPLPERTRFYSNKAKLRGEELAREEEEFFGGRGGRREDRDFPPRWNVGGWGPGREMGFQRDWDDFGPPMDSWMDGPPRGSWMDERPRDQWMNRRPRDSWMDEPPRDPWMDRRPRDSWMDEPPRDHWMDRPGPGPWERDPWEPRPPRWDRWDTDSSRRRGVWRGGDNRRGGQWGEF